MGIYRDLKNLLEHELLVSGPYLFAGPPVEDRVVTSSLIPETPQAERNEPVMVAEPEVIYSVSLDHREEKDDMATLFDDKPEVPAAGLTPWERLEQLIPPDSPLRAMKTLEEVEHYVRNTVLIPLDQTRLNPVFGVGDPHANLMVIGEAPGADEDRLGEPFVGRAGQLLNKILESIHFKREEVYIANILKSRPPNNRDPLPDEVAAHIPILYKQIALIRPKIILCVGRTAGNGLLGQASSLASLRNKFLDFYGIPLVVTYHPAALLRNPQWKRGTWEDVQMLRTRYDELVKS